MKNLKKRLKAGETLNGCWLNLGSSLTAEIVGKAGFDWVLIDLEHGAGTERELLAQLQALEASNTGALVRVESNAKQRIQRVLDLGAEGIMCPQIRSAEEAKNVIQSMYYPPYGNRGVAKMVRATEFGKQFENYKAHLNENLLGIIQIETAEALNQLDQIAEFDGLDVLFIGPADLSMSLGIFGQFDHPIFKEALKDTIVAANKAGKATGILLFNPDDYGTYYEMGIKLIACGSDATFVASGSQSIATNLNAKKIQYQNNKH